MPVSRMAAVTRFAPSLPAAHAAGALMSRMFHCHEKSCAWVGSIFGVAATTVVASLNALCVSGRDTMSSASTSEIPLTAESDFAASDVSPVTTARPLPLCIERTVPPSAATFVAKSCEKLLPRAKTRYDPAAGDVDATTFADTDVGAMARVTGAVAWSAHADSASATAGNAKRTGTARSERFIGAPLRGQKGRRGRDGGVGG